MNDTFEIESNSMPTDLGADRLHKFGSILSEELLELGTIATDPNAGVDRLVELADLLADIIVYCTSESLRWGIPILKVLDAVMRSQASKLVNGKPIKDDRQKFMKGPDYQPPEQMIREIIVSQMRQAMSDKMEKKVCIGRTVDYPDPKTGETKRGTIIGYDPNGTRSTPAGWVISPDEAMAPAVFVPEDKLTIVE